MKAIRLKTEYLTDPIGIDIAQPRLFWNCEGGVKQTAYEILASDDTGAVLWQSGRVESSSMRAEWGGSPVPPGTRVKWKIHLWDEDNVCGEWCDAWFETGIVRWQGMWISGDYAVNPLKRYPVDCFRKRFDAAAAIRARLYITACGVYEAKLNGRRCGDFILAPGVTDYRKRIQYQTIAEAVQAAKNAETVIVFAGLPGRYESEGFDRDSMKMPEGHVRMIEAVSAANPDTVLVLLCGAPVECPWADRVKAILYMGLPGQAGGEAIANLLYGRVNPSGRLAESWPCVYEDVPSSAVYGKMNDALYAEGVYVGYRFYDKAGVRVRWPFGHGLSYTSFGYSDLSVEGRNVTVTVSNTGNQPGAEVVQLYIGAPQDGIHRPVRELKRFCKIFLQPGESETMSFTLDDRCFALWQDGWKVSGGTYTVQIAGLSAEIEVTGEAVAIPAWQADSWYENCHGKPTQSDWERMTGRTYTAPVLKKGAFTMDNTVLEMKDHSLVMKMMAKVTEKIIARSNGGKVDYENPEFRMMINASLGGPLRSMQISGAVKGGIFSGLLEMANEHFLKGIWKMMTNK